MKTFFAIALLTINSLVMAGELPDAMNCSCPTKSCPNYDAAKCGHDNNRYTGKASGTDKKAKKAKASASKG
ncbi:MAG: hypothetical protein AB7I27_07735 [Bacteriovoracaceae bacterium]